MTDDELLIDIRVIKKAINIRRKQISDLRMEAHNLEAQNSSAEREVAVLTLMLLDGLSRESARNRVEP